MEDFGEDFCSGWRFTSTAQEQHGREGEHTDVVMVTWIFLALQDEPLLVVNGVITYNSHKWPKIHG